MAMLDANGIEGIPLYNGDDEAAQGLPPAAVELKRKLFRSRRDSCSSRRNNNPIPGVLKNAIDWMSRPSDETARHGDVPGIDHSLLGTTPEATREANLKAPDATFAFFDRGIGSSSAQ